MAYTDEQIDQKFQEVAKKDCTYNVCEINEILKDKISKDFFNRKMIEVNEKIEDAKTEVIDNLESEDTDKALSANQGRILNERIDSINASGVEMVDALDSEDTDMALTAIQGRVLNEIIEALGQIPASVEVVDNLESVDVDKPLSANQGRILKEMVENNVGGGGSSVEVVDSFDSTDTTKALSANRGRLLNDAIGDISTALTQILG